MADMADIGGMVPRRSLNGIACQRRRYPEPHRAQDGDAESLAAGGRRFSAEIKTNFWQGTPLPIPDLLGASGSGQ